MKNKLSILFTSFFVIILLGAGCASVKQEGNTDEKVIKSTEPIKIGFIAPLTGDAATVGESMKYAIEIARDEINNTGGIDGRQVEVIFEDGGCEAKKAVLAGTKLISVDKVPVIIGGACSSETLAVAPLAEQAGVVMISAASTNPDVTNAGDFIFRFIPDDTYQGKFAAEHLYSTKGYKKIAVLYVNNDWGIGIKQVFILKAKELGAEIVTEGAYAQDARDLRTELTKVKNSGADVLYFVGSSEASIPALKQIKELELNIPIFGADMWDDPKIPQEAGLASEGAEYTVAANLNLPEEFIQEMNTRTGDTQIGTYPPRAYDIMTALKKVITKVGDNSTNIKQELYKLKNYKGIADVYTMDENGDMTGSNFVIKIYKNGELAVVK